jgi:hypothetical protein
MVGADRERFIVCRRHDAGISSSCMDSLLRFPVHRNYVPNSCQLKIEMPKSLCLSRELISR